MKTKHLKKDATLMLIFFATIFLASCNRGYGCANYFSLAETIGNFVNNFVGIIF